MKVNFGFLPTEITRLKTKGLLFTESIKIIWKIDELLESTLNSVITFQY